MPVEDRADTMAGNGAVSDI